MVIVNMTDHMVASGMNIMVKIQYVKPEWAKLRSIYVKELNFFLNESKRIRALIEWIDKNEN